MRRLFRQFSFPGGIPSHVAPETPGSIHEGGELGYALVHAYGAAFDNPDLLVVLRRSATARPRPVRWPRAGTRTSSSTRRATARCCRSCTSTATRSPTRPCSRGSPTRSCARCWRAMATRPFVEGDDPAAMHQLMAATLDDVVDEIADDPAARARGRRAGRPRWPMIVLRTPKGWTGPEGGRRPAGRGHRSAPIRFRSPTCATNPEHLAQLEAWMRSYRPEELFDERRGRCAPELAALAPAGERRMGANPHANGGAAAPRPRAARLPRLRGRGRTRPATDLERGDARARRIPARRHARQPGRTSASSGPTRPRPTASARCSRRPTARGRPRRSTTDDHLAPRRPGDGGPQRAPLPGLAGGLPADRPPRAVQLLRGVHPHHRLDVQPARQVAEGDPRRSRGGARSPRSTTCCPPTSGARTTTASPTRTPASSTTSSTRRPRSSASTCRPTPTACCRSPTTACAAATTST